MSIPRETTIRAAQELLRHLTAAHALRDDTLHRDDAISALLTIATDLGVPAGDDVARLRAMQTPEAAE